MKATTHALVGGLSGALVGRPAPAFVAGAVSHALLDALPHRDDDRPLHLIADGCGVLAVLALAIVAGNIGMAAGVIGGVIPDLENVPDILFKRKGRKFFPSHWWEHEPAANSRWTGIEPVLFVAAAVGFVVVVLGRTGPSGVF
jgi:hypothetical protein